jgi:hypothetical protein
MRLTRASCLAVAGVLAGACAHNDVVETITRDGSNTIVAVNMTPATAAYPAGSSAINRFLVVIDTSVADAFGRSSANPANFRASPDGCYDPSIYPPGPTPVTSYTPPNRLKPAIIPVSGTRVAQAYSQYGGGFINTIAYIASGDNSCNGSTFWEIWYDIRRLKAGTRYVMGLARYALQQNGALDWADMGIQAAVTTPDSLYFRGGDFNPQGRKKNGAYVGCSSANVVQPVSGANPLLIGGATSALAGADTAIEIDQTICDTNGVWSHTMVAANSPIPANNNTALGANQYNFLVVWQALADSTPDYTKPVYREQIGPLIDAAGNVINNSYAPFPLPAAPPVSATARADTLTATFTNLVPLNSGVYQLWLVRSGSDSAVKITTDKVIRRVGTTNVDTINNTGEFNLTGTQNSVQVKLDFVNFAPVRYDAVILGVTTTGATTLPAAQIAWVSGALTKIPGEAPPALAGTAKFGSFNKGTGSLLFGSAGSATGGVFGHELREDVVRLARPPIGYQYQVWLTNASDTSKHFNLGSLLTPYPDLQPLDNADTRQTEPLSGVEITEAAIRAVEASQSFFCGYDHLSVRLALRNNLGTLPPLTALSSGTSKDLGVIGCP